MDTDKGISWGHGKVSYKHVCVLVLLLGLGLEGSKGKNIIHKKYTFRLKKKIKSWVRALPSSDQLAL